MATQISVPGAHGVPPLIFTVTGVSTTNYAQDFQSALVSASGNGSLKINVLSSGATQTSISGAGSTVLNEILSNTTITSPYNLTDSGEYTLALVGSSTTINAATFGHSTVVAGGAVTFMESSASVAMGGGHDNVDFIAGNNVFFGNTASGDTVTGGAGYDTINTGTGATTVFSGAGHTLINLNDTVAGSASGDITFLGDGTATVNANGLADTVVGAAPGQTIFAVGPATANDTIVIGAPDSPGTAGGDTVVLGAASVSVFDSVGGNSIFGGAGNLTFVGQTNTTTVADSIVSASGTTAIFASNNNDISFFDSASGSNGSLTAVAGAGNETLNGAGAGSFNFFGLTDTTTAASNNTTIIGGSGSDYFSTGTGNETFYAGTGSDVFGLNTIAGSAGADHITIYDFSAADSVSFNGESAADMNTALNSGTVTNGNLTITLSDKTTVTFMNTTNLNGHTYT